MLPDDIILACRGYPALTTGLVFPSADVSRLIINLHLSTINYEALHNHPKQGAYVQFPDDDEGKQASCEACFTDRQCRGGGNSFQGQ
jgi:hypothetical protein